MEKGKTSTIQSNMVDMQDTYYNNIQKNNLSFFAEECGTLPINNK